MACPGQTLTLQSVYSFRPPPEGASWQWKYNDVSLAGATGSTLTVQASAANVGRYTCAVRYIYPDAPLSSLVSKPFVVSIAAPPAITSQPQNASACASAMVTLSVAATGTGSLSYQWRKAGVPIDATANPSARTAALSLAAITGADAASYDVVVTDRCTSVTSQAAAVTLASCCRVEYNGDGSLNPDDIGDFITDYFTTPAIPGPGAYAIACPANAPPYDAGYKAAYTSDGLGQCGEPNPDNLGDWITDYFVGC